jgi:hypothetical protein
MLSLRTVAFLAVLFAPATAFADAESCMNAYTAGQRLRKEGKLRAAERETLACSLAECPAMLRKDCLVWLEEIRRDLPGLVVVAKGDDGCDRGDARVTIDGEAAALDGRPIPVDPGAHVVAVELPGGATDTQNVMVAVGEGARRHEVHFGAPDAVCGAPRATKPVMVASRPTPPLAYVLGGVGLLSLGVGGVFAITAWSQKGTLDECRPSCATSDVDSMRTKYVVSDVLLGIGTITLATAALVYLTRPTRSTPAAALRAPWL